MRSDQLYVLHRPSWKVQLLPRPTIVLGVIDNAFPLRQIHRHLDEIEIRTIVTVPQQQLQVIDDADRAQSDDNALVVGISDHVPGVSLLHVVRGAVVVEQRLAKLALNHLRAELQRGDVLFGPCN